MREEKLYPVTRDSDEGNNAGNVQSLMNLRMRMLPSACFPLDGTLTVFGEDEDEINGT